MSRFINILSFVMLICSVGCQRTPPNPFQFNASDINQGVVSNNAVVSHTINTLHAKMNMSLIPPDNGAESAINTLTMANILPANFSTFHYYIDSVAEVSVVTYNNYDNIVLIDQSNALINETQDTGIYAYELSNDIFGPNYRISGILYYLTNAVTSGNILVYGASNNGLLGPGPLTYITNRNVGSQNYIPLISNLSLQMKGSNSILQALNQLVNDTMQADGALPQNITVFSYSPDSAAQPALVTSITSAAKQKRIRINFIHYASQNKYISNDYQEVANLTGGFLNQTTFNGDYILICKNADALLHNSLPVYQIQYHITASVPDFNTGFWLQETWNLKVQGITETNHIPVFTKIYQ